MQSDILITLNQVSLLLSGLFLLWGTCVFISIRMHRWWAYTATAGTIWIVLAVLSGFSIRVLTIPTYLFLGGVYMWTGSVIFRSHTFGGLGKYFTASSFVVWGIYKLTPPFLGEESWLAPCDEFSRLRVY